MVATTWQDRATAAGWTPPAPPAEQPAPAAAPVELFTPGLASGTSTSEFKVTIATLLVNFVAGAVITVNKGLELTQTQQSWLLGAIVAAMTWVTHQYAKRRTTLKVAQLAASQPLPTGRVS